MTLSIGGPTPAAAPAPAAAVPTGTAQAAVMARQAAATPRAAQADQLPREEPERPVAYGVEAPLASHEMRAVHNEERPKQAEHRAKEDMQSGRGKKVDMKV